MMRIAYLNQKLDCTEFTDPLLDTAVKYCYTAIEATRLNKDPSIEASGGEQLVECLEKHSIGRTQCLVNIHDDSIVEIHIQFTFMHVG